MESGTTDCDHASSLPQHEVFTLFLLASLLLNEAKVATEEGSAQVRPHDMRDER